MNTKRTVLALALTMLGALAFGTGLYYSGSIGATDVNTATTFTDNASGGSASAFSATHVVVVNDGASSVYVALNDTTATTSDRKLLSGESFSATWDPRLGGAGWAGVGLICAAGETATVRVWAER